MSDAGGRPIRGYRPSRYGSPEDDEGEGAQEARLANVEVYAKRASEGLPIFKEDPEGTGSAPAGKA